MISFMFYRGQNREAEIKLIFSFRLESDGVRVIAFAAVQKFLKFSIKTFLYQKSHCAYQPWTNVFSWSFIPDISSIHSMYEATAV